MKVQNRSLPEKVRIRSLGILMRSIKEVCFLMKKLSSMALVLSLALIGAGCSSAPAESTSSTKPAESAAASSASNAPASESKAEFEEIKNAFTQNGFTLSNVEEGDTLSMNAEDSNGSVTVTAHVLATEEQASSIFASTRQQLESDGYLEVNAYSNGSTRVTEMLNDYNTVYAFAGVREEKKVVICIQDILQPARPNVITVLKALGYPVQ